MIDLHSHILPGIDDGSQSVEETQALLETLYNQEVTTVAATPHFYANRENPEDFLRRRKDAAEKLPTGEAFPRVVLGAEVAYFPGMGSCEALIPLRIGNSNLLLVEMPFRPWKEKVITDICNIPSRLGLIPVLAHVDRYRARGQFPKYCEQLLENDVLFQCNADIFESIWGRQWALRQLRNGTVHFLGSDCHNLTTRRPRLQQASQIIANKLGPEVLDQLNTQAAQLLE